MGKENTPSELKQLTQELLGLRNEVELHREQSKVKPWYRRPMFWMPLLLTISLWLGGIMLNQAQERRVQRQRVYDIQQQKQERLRELSQKILNAKDNLELILRETYQIERGLREQNVSIPYLQNFIIAIGATRLNQYQTAETFYNHALETLRNPSTESSSMEQFRIYRKMLDLYIKWRGPLLLPDFEKNVREHRTLEIWNNLRINVEEIYKRAKELIASDPDIGISLGDHPKYAEYEINRKFYSFFGDSPIYGLSTPDIEPTNMAEFRQIHSQIQEFENNIFNAYGLRRNFLENMLDNNPKAGKYIIEVLNTLKKRYPQLELDENYKNFDYSRFMENEKKNKSTKE